MKRTIFYDVLASLCLVFALTGCTSDKKMDFQVSDDGTIRMKCGGTEQISRSPIGLMLREGQLYEPQSAKQKGDQITVTYEWGDVVLESKERPNGSLRLEVSSVPEGTDAFVFGPYMCPATQEVGEYLGAAWHKDGSAVCIQSLNPKTMGGCEIPFENKTSYASIEMPVASLKDGVGQLKCSAIDFTHPRRMLSGGQGASQIAEAIPAPDGSIEGAAIILTCAADADALLQDIGSIEEEENLPHPMIDGEWAKTSPRATDLYFVINNANIDAQIRMAERAGIHWMYYGDPFASWGHFNINTNLYPKGMEDFKATMRKAKEHGIHIGFHTLSNFIHTHDPYVTPVPHKDLLDHDPTPILKGVSENDTEIFIGEQLSYASHYTTSTVRIGDELIKFGGFDAEKLCLTGCQRGAYGTTPAAHAEGSILTHLSDHGYATLYPTAKLQDEMADNLSNTINESHILRMSFDGLEGCRATGHGEFGCSRYVQRVFDKVGNDLICDASTLSHYRWHAHSYFNWGEPWWHYQKRGGMYNYRAINQSIFRRNLLPCMLGWYGISNGRGRFEPTLPEMLEDPLARTVAFDAGAAIQVDVEEGPKLDEYLDMIRLWQEFRATVKVPEELRKRMQDQRTDWHLTKENDKWILSEIAIEEHDLAFVENSLKMESGSTGYSARPDMQDGQTRNSCIVIDRSSADTTAIPFITEPFNCRIRVGTPLAHGQIRNLRFCGGWFGGPLLSFEMEANAGDYLVYRGGKTLYRYDSNYNPICQYEATSGNELVVDGSKLSGYTLAYDVVGQPKNDPPLQIMLKHFRTRQRFEF